MTDRVVMITGAFGVLGSAVASAMAGNRLALVDFAEGPAPLAASPDVFLCAKVDLTDASAADAAVNLVVERFGRLDALLNIAGGFRWLTVEESTAADWTEIYRLNVLTAANACRAAIPHLKRVGGRIVNVGSAAALVAGVGMGPYAAAKLGVHALTQALAAELKQEGVAVNAVLPSIIDTPTNRKDMPSADPSAWVSPAALAEVILFLAGEAASAVTGALVPVTGRT